MTSPLEPSRIAAPAVTLPAPRQRFDIRFDRCPQTLPRLLDLFAQRDQLLVSVCMQADREGYRLLIEVDGLPAQHIEVLAEKMRAIILVRKVSLHGT